MRRIAADELVAWCERSGYALKDWSPSLPSAARHIDFPLPSGFQALAELLDDLVVFDDTASERLVWLRDWTIWDDRSQEIGLRHWAMLTLPRDQPAGQSLEAYVLPAAEWRETIALLAVPALYGWDAHLFFNTGAALFNLSHEGRVSVFIGIQGPIRLDAWAAEQEEQHG